MEDSYLKCTISDRNETADKTRIFFACHPDDFDAYFEELVNEINEIRECAVYYYEADGKDHEKQIEEDLLFMNLVVIPVTARLLEDWDRAYETGIAFALENRISVLPIVMEEEVARKLLSEYGKRFGNRQYIYRADNDYTAVGYKEKLRNHLEFLLFDEKTVQRIKDAFDALIFISYRKKDRGSVNELISKIHAEKEFQSVATWYDEFLRLGEDFTESIKEAIDESVLCALAVTPSVLEEGNYILEHEYDMMRSAGKDIVSVELRQTEKERLKALYGIDTLISLGEEGQLYETLRSSLKNVGFTRTQNDPVHDYLLGLAYLKGIQTEIDINRSFELLSSAADNGVIEALPVLVSILKNNSMFLSSEYKGYDNEEALLRYEERYVKELEKLSDQGIEERQHWIRELYTLAGMYLHRFRVESYYADFHKEKYNGTELSQGVDLYQKILSLAKDRSSLFEKRICARTCRELSAVLENGEKERYLLKSADLWMGICEKDPEASDLQETIDICLRTGHFYGSLKADQASRYFEKAAGYAGLLKDLFPSRNADLLDVHTQYEYGQLLREAGRKEEAREHYFIAKERIEKILEKDRNARVLSETYPVYAGIARTYDSMETVEEATRFMEKAVEVERELDRKKNTVNVARDLWNHYEFLEHCAAMKNDYLSQKKYFRSAQEYMYGTKWEIRHITDSCQRFAPIAAAHGDYETAGECYDRQLSILYGMACDDEDLPGLRELLKKADSILCEARTWKGPETKEALLILEDRRGVIEHKIRFYERCEEEDMPFHRPD